MVKTLGVVDSIWLGSGSRLWWLEYSVAPDIYAIVEFLEAFGWLGVGISFMIARGLSQLKWRNKICCDACT